MQLIPQPQDSSETLKFKLYGFPDEALVGGALEHAYFKQAEARRQFLIYNMFDELIFSGAMDAEGRVAMLDSKQRRDDGDKYKKED